jgi:hypothetical protein
LALLNIPSHTAIGESNDTSLHAWYVKYKAVVEAQHTLGMMSAEGTWPGKKPTNTDLIKLFLSPSMWHSHVKKMSKVSQYPVMQKWLEGQGDAPSDLELWGFERGSYNFADLFNWFDRQEEGPSKGKDKGKGKQKEGTDDNEGGSKKKKKKTEEATGSKKPRKARK